MRDVARRVDRQRRAHPVRRAGAAEVDRLRVEDPRRLLVEEARQHLGRRRLRAGQLVLAHRGEEHVRAPPILALLVRQQVRRAGQAVLARRGVAVLRRGLGHVLEHHAAHPPAAARDALGDGEARGKLLGLGEVGLGTGREAAAGDGGDALIGGHALALVDQDREVAPADQIEGRGALVQALRVVAGVAAQARGPPRLGRGVPVGRDQARGPVAAHLDRELPAQLHRLPDQRGQHRHLGDERLDRGGVVVLRQHPVQGAAEARDAPADVAAVELERQYGVVPGDFLDAGHGALRR